MPTPLTVQSQLALIAAGTSPIMTNADATGHTYRNVRGVEDLEPEIYVENNTASAITLTMVSARQSNFGTFPNKVVTCAAASLTILPAFDVHRFTDPGTGLASFTLSVTANVRVAAVEPGRFYKE